ncbi:class I SAM-dependent methyltransferase [Chitinophagaceae bacterium MMS25-I14]
MNPRMHTICKYCGHSNDRVRYQLRHAQVVVCSACGFHYTTHLDEAIADSATNTSPEVAEYIRTQLQSNDERFQRHVQYVTTLHDGGMVLDIGSGGGLFLYLLKQKGFEVYGIEPAPERLNFSRQEYSLEHIYANPVEAAFWQDNYHSFFDVITLWDVIEHVNDPRGTIKAAVRLLKPGGILWLDTPARDAFYHRFGAFTYRLTGGKMPTFLNAMYSDHPFGHKQIFTLTEMEELLQQEGLQVLQAGKLHELSFPHRFYLEKLLRSKSLANVLNPLVAAFFKLFRIKNKMLVAARKI